MKRHAHAQTTEQKVAAVLAGLRGDREHSEVCAQHEIDERTYAAWMQGFLSGGREALARMAVETAASNAHAGHAHLPHLPAWLRRTRGETRLHVVLAVLAAILLQAVLPDRLALHPVWLLPALEVVLLIVLTVFNPMRMTRSTPLQRATGLFLCGLVVAANAFSGIRLVHDILTGHGTKDPNTLFGSGASIYLTNVIAFSLLYWELDRGGPVARANATDPHPDFLFAQMASPEVADPNWEPTFGDYLYTSLTNATAFSPTDTLPLTLWAKTLMGIQSVVALGVVGLVVARAVNILS
ncbi:MAG TPA: transposase [Sporichthyaceae bacterium]